MRTIRIEGPGKNSLSSDLMNAIISGLHDAAGEPVLITGAGDAFSAGLNLKEMAGLDAAGMDRFLRTLEEMVVTLHHYPGPTAAAVNGHAIAGGCVITLCCDFRIMTTVPKARIGLNEVALG
ncbi:MAG: enoyl-CoA hydratase/isomerase family protein, partial [Myxococcales bacterium]|nr:enoyl-CoA hydratase/isomerase family protein [Myxococcales bacterium]